MSRSDQQGARIELKKLGGGRLALKFPHSKEPILLNRLMLHYEVETEDGRRGRLTAILAPTEARGAVCPDGSFATGSRFCWNRLALHHNLSEEWY